MSHDYAVRGRTERFRNNMFDVVSDDVVMPGGKVAARDYLRHVGAVGVVALDDEDRVVLVRQYRHPVRRRLWELPAGLIDVPGEDLVDVARRELAEETDLRAEHYELLLDLHPSPGCSDEVIRIFLATGLSEVPEDERHERRFEEAEMTVTRMPVAEAAELALRGEITNAACAAGVLAAALRAAGAAPKVERPLDAPLPREADAGPG